MTSDPTHTLSQLFLATAEKKAAWNATEAASANYRLACIKENMATLLSRAQPLNDTGVARPVLAAIFSYLQHGDLKRLERELVELA